VPEVVIALRGVRKDYRGLRPLRLEHLEVRQGESVALLGFDRVAAEVLVNLITGATLPDSGEVDVFGTATRAITDPDAWLAAMDQFGILSERIVLLEPFTVEQNLALPFSLEVDEMPLDVRSSVRQLADEVGIVPDQLPQSVARLDAEAQVRVRLGKALALGPRVLFAEHPNAALPPDEVPRFAADLAGIAARRHLTMVVMTADATFARAVSDRVLTLKPATGELTPASGWRDWFTRRVC
jgi:predicted ABC-type transport system involved in lysophospholipase L1 biosynthesis ATPase subunit